MSLTYALALGFGLSLVLSIVTLINFDAFCRSLATIGEARERRTGSSTCRISAIIVTVLLACAQTVFMFFLICNGFRMGMSECPFADTTTEEDTTSEPTFEDLIVIKSLASSIKWQFICLQISVVSFPISWLMVIFTFFIVLYHYEP